jgi:hypothetical protein
MSLPQTPSFQHHKYNNLIRCKPKGNFGGVFPCISGKCIETLLKSELGRFSILQFFVSLQIETRSDVHTLSTTSSGRVFPCVTGSEENREYRDLFEIRTPSLLDTFIFSILLRK